VIPLRDSNPVRRVPVVTYGLIAACVLVFLYELTLEGAGRGAGLAVFFDRYGVVPSRLAAALNRGEPTSPAVLAVLSSMFLHAGWLHLLGNMLYLWIFGNNVEDRLGRPLYLGFYLAGGVVAALAQVAVAPGSQVVLVGASGAIAAVLGAYLVLYPGARVLSLVFFGLFYQLVNVPAVIVLGLWFVLQLLPGITSLGAETATGGGTAFFAHIGGFAAGMVAGLIVRAGTARPMGVG